VAASGAVLALMAIVGLGSAIATTGRMISSAVRPTEANAMSSRPRDVAEVARRFRGLPEAVTRIVVSHHPFDIPADGDESDVVGRAQMAMQAFSGCGVDLFLSGHLHHSHSGNTAARYEIDGFAALVVQAGTATSTRERGEANAFNVLRIGAADMALETMAWTPGRDAFTCSARRRFHYASGRGWSARPA